MARLGFIIRAFTGERDSPATKIAELLSLTTNPNEAHRMPVTVLYPEERQVPDLDLEREIFGSEVTILHRPKPRLADLDPAECSRSSTA